MKVTTAILRIMNNRRKSRESAALFTFAFLLSHLLLLPRDLLKLTKTVHGQYRESDLVSIMHLFDLAVEYVPWELLGSPSFSWDVGRCGSALSLPLPLWFCFFFLSCIGVRLPLLWALRCGQSRLLLQGPRQIGEGGRRKRGTHLTCDGDAVAPALDHAGAVLHHVLCSVPCTATSSTVQTLMPCVCMTVCVCGSTASLSVTVSRVNTVGVNVGLGSARAATRSASAFHFLLNSECLSYI